MSPQFPGDGPPRPSAHVSVYNVPPNPILVQLLGEFLGVWLHWRREGRRGRRARACLGDRCPMCIESEMVEGVSDRRGYGYVPAFHATAGPCEPQRIALCVPGINQRSFAPPHVGRWHKIVHNELGSGVALAVTPRPDLPTTPSIPPFPILRVVAQIFRVEPAALATFDWEATELYPPAHPAIAAAVADVRHAIQSPLQTRLALSDEEFKKLGQWQTATARNQAAMAKALWKEFAERVGPLRAEQIRVELERGAAAPDPTPPPTTATDVGRQLWSELASATAAPGSSPVPSASASFTRTVRPIRRRKGGAS